MFSLSIGPARSPRRLAGLVLAAFILVGAGPAASQVTGPVTSANAQFIAASYSELLGRVVDTGGLDFHLDTVASGGTASRRSVAYGLLFSPEGSGREVGRAYDEILQRTPDSVGAQYWTNHLVGHGVLDLRVLLLASDEFFVRVGATNTAWLDALYGLVLERSPESAGQAYWLGLLDFGLPRALIAGSIHHSNEALGHRVDAYYTDVLSRAPSQLERGSAIEVVRHRGERYLRAELWASDEAFESYLQGAWS